MHVCTRGERDRQETYRRHPISKGGRKNASIQEIRARKARLIHRIAKLRAAVEIVHDLVARLNALRSKLRSLGFVSKKRPGGASRRRTSSAGPDWSLAFDDPIALPDGNLLRTLHDAEHLRDFVAKGCAGAHRVGDCGRDADPGSQERTPGDVRRHRHAPRARRRQARFPPPPSGKPARKFRIVR
jgi:hypothetical protein